MSEFDSVEEQQAEETRKQLEKDNLLQEQHDLEFILSTPQGLRFIRNIVIEGGAFQRLFHGNSKDAFLLGRRDFALTIWIKIYESFPEKAIRILQVEKPPNPPES